MSFTFKGMLGSLGRSEQPPSSKLAASQLNGHRNNNDGNNNNNNNNNNDDDEKFFQNGQQPQQQQPASEINDHNQSKKKSFSKRGKKRISTMMSKLNSSITTIHQNKFTNNHSTNGANGKQQLHPHLDEHEEFSEPLCDTPESQLEQQQQQQSADNDDDDKAGFLLPEEECDIPTFLHTADCDRQLIEETRRLLRERYAKNPDSFYDDDYKRMLNDDWTVSRFLLRRRLDPKRTAKLMEECGRFRKQYKMSEVKLWEFPSEFHKAGGLFKYAPDRVGNLTVYMRVKMYRRVPEISDVFKAFILCCLEEADVENGGRGVAIVFDLSGCGLQNVDLGFLSWLLSSFRNYCPKGVSYIIVYNLPWILSTTCRLAMTWMSASNRRALRFVHGDEIENFIARENLPDYCGGTCKINYRKVPDGSRPAIEVCDRLDMTPNQALKIRELFKEYLSDDEDDDFQDAKSKDESNCDTSTNQNGLQQAAAVAAPQQQQQQPRHGLDNSQPGPDLTLTSPLGSPVDLVSQASKFIA